VAFLQGPYEDLVPNNECERKIYLVA
jgi:hypothetical protein